MADLTDETEGTADDEKPIDIGPFSIVKIEQYVQDPWRLLREPEGSSNG